ncbi:unnamed protein product [Clonostachys rosea f. rosea IK726]|uniref:Uncharacterized protein n=1 Tax=Clonostachys rosea f. rosea IK726 TaxID=1349383 RepID=A0ACA9TXN8_BIOOC|nr:unnamed protein product [Clonostachys rosea f. rosea IK726]
MADNSVVPASSKVSPFPVPAEILNHIITFLDPWGVWQLSKTCRYMRDVIKPGRKEYLELLLQLESFPTLGGGTRLFTGSDFNPTSNLSLWKQNYWACSGCMSLLTHEHFNNHSLLQLAYRKLDPRTSAQRSVTSWKPSLRGKKWGQEGPKYSASNEHERLGAKRHHRLCNECLFRAGRLKSKWTSAQGMHGGTLKTPIQIGRFVCFASALDRYFPNVGEALGLPAPKDGIFTSRQQPWVLYMVRCPTCSVWQELSSFRVGGSFPGWSPTHGGDGMVRYRGGLNHEDFNIDHLGCHGCVLRYQGFRYLCVDLLDWYCLLMKSTRFEIDLQLLSGWSAIRMSQRRFSRKYKKDIRRILQDVDHMYQKRYRPDSELGYQQVALVQLRHREFKEIWEKMMETDSHIANGKLGTKSHFMSWLTNFDKILATWQWLRACQDAVESDPGLGLYINPGCQLLVHDETNGIITGITPLTTQDRSLDEI